MILSNEYLKKFSHYTCQESQFDYGDRVKTVFKLYPKVWWQPRKKLVFKWIIDNKQQYEPDDARELRVCLSNHFLKRNLPL